MGIFGPGVGGGFLAAAGAVGGAGKGLAEVGEAQTKMNLESKMQDLTQKREEAITRLQGQQQSGLEEARAGHEKERVGEEIAGRSAVAHYETGEREAEAEKGRTQATSENAKKQASQEKIAAGHDVARVTAAKAHAPAGKAPPKEWTPRSLTLQGSFDPVSHAMVPGRTMNVMTHRDGSSWVQVGDKLLPYDASQPDGLGVKPESLRRTSQTDNDMRFLMQNPLGFVPPGYKNAGMSNKDAFVQSHGYLPRAYLQASQTARDSVQPAAGSNASSAGGGVGDEATAPENEDQSETEPDPQAPQ
jgi:hypothetical protein